MYLEGVSLLPSPSTTMPELVKLLEIEAPDAGRDVNMN